MPYDVPDKPTDETGMEPRGQREMCRHQNRELLAVIYDWFDGDEDEKYRCLDCGEYFGVYIPR